MARRTLFAILAAASILGLGATPGRCANHALLIGISKYDQYNKSGLFGNLDCDEDVARIDAALVKTFHFSADPKSGEVVLLSKPAQTTRTAILAAFDKLISVTNPGDIVYVHYSGHGSQVPDPKSPLGLDDALVVSDYKDDQSNLITGKELASIMRRLKDKDGDGQVTLSFDCCHSATITRGSEKKRGIGWAEYVAWMKAHHEAAPVRPAGIKSRGDNSNIEKLALRDLTVPGLVVLSACSNDSCAYEVTYEPNKDMGRLSYVLAEAFSKATPTTTYGQLYDQIRAEFAEKFSDQSPQIDGASDGYLLGGQAPAPQKSILVYLTSPGHYALDAGKLQDMTAGSTFAVYDKNATAFTDAAKIADAQITSVDLTASTIALTQKTRPVLATDDFSGAHAIESTHDYGKFSLTLDAVSVRAALPDQADRILADLATAHLVSTDVPAGKTADIRAVRSASAGRDEAKITLVRGDTGAPIRDLVLSGNLTQQFKAALDHLAQYRYTTTVLNRTDPDGSVAVKIRLVPADVTVDGDGYTVFKADKQGDAKQLKVGDYFTIEMENPSDTNLFVTVLDIDSNGDIAQAWPNVKHTVQDNVIPSDTTKWIKLWNGSDISSVRLIRCSTPDPAEMYKAIATDTYVSYAAVVNRGARGGGPFDALLAPAAGLGSRGTETIQAPTGWATSNVTFAVAPAGASAGDAPK